MTSRLSLIPLAAALALALTACSNDADTVTAAGADTAPDTTSAPEATTTSTHPALAEVPVIPEAFKSTMTPEDNIDSLASWTREDGTTWVFGTAKATDRLVVYDGDTGETLRTLGERGEADGQFKRPNGIFVIDDLLLVVERDNRRVQGFALPSLEPLGHFGAGDLIKPYGLWVDKATDGQYQLYVTDAYMAGEDADGEDILPPFEELDERVKRYTFTVDADGLHGELAGSFGDTSEAGALRVVESLWGDPASNRLLVAEEDETYANEFKVYDLEGNFSGQVFGADIFAAQAEGIALYTCGDGGWWVTTEQAKDVTTFHLFERDSLEHAGAFRGEMVSNTDGIWLHQAATQEFPSGAFYAVHDDQGMVAFDWRDIARTLELPDCR